MDMKVQTKFDALIAKVPTMGVDDRMKLYIQTRAAKTAAKQAHDEQAAQFDKIMEACENSMLADADKQGVSGFRTPHGTSYIAETAKYSIADDSAFYSFVKSAGDLDFFERRVSSTHVTQYMEQNGGTLPPGLNVYRERVMRVRKGG